jgi:hypothetical protein
LGYLVFTGKEISADDVVRKWAGANHDSNSLCSLIDSSLGEISRFKVGNVVAIEHNSDDRVMLRLVSQTPQRTARTSAPGRTKGRTKRCTQVADRPRI